LSTQLEDMNNGVGAEIICRRVLRKL